MRLYGGGTRRGGHVIPVDSEVPNFEVAILVPREAGIGAGVIVVSEIGVRNLSGVNVSVGVRLKNVCVSWTGMSRANRNKL